MTEPTDFAKQQTLRTPLYHSGFMLLPNISIRFNYTDWEGKVGIRRAMIREFVWGASEWHPEEQFLLVAIDLDKHEQRTFAVASMTQVEKL